MVNKGVNGVNLGLRIPTLMRGHYGAHAHRFFVPERRETFRKDVDVTYNPSDGTYVGDNLMWNNGNLDLAVSKIVLEAGKFYEVVTVGLFGGLMGKVFRMEPGRVSIEDYQQPALFEEGGFVVDRIVDNIARPDVYNPDSKRLFDSKACATGRDLPVKDRQIELYKQLLVEMPQHSLDYVVYVHGLGSLQGFSGTVDDLRGGLARNTHCGIVLPFSIVEALHSRRDNGLDPSDRSKLVYRFDGVNKHYTSILSTTLKRLMFPEDFSNLVSILGLDERAYDWDVMGWPMGSIVEGYKPSYFPMIVISENSLDLDIPF